MLRRLLELLGIGRKARTSSGAKSGPKANAKAKAKAASNAARIPAVSGSQAMAEGDMRSGSAGYSAGAGGGYEGHS